MGMSEPSIEEYTGKMRARYARLTGRKARGKLLDEFVEVTGWERKHANKVLLNTRRRTGRRGKRGAPRRYGGEVGAALKTCWLAMEQPCGKRMKDMLPLWAGHLDCPEEIRVQVAEISAVKALVEVRAQGWDILIGGQGEPSFSGYLQSDGLRAYGTFIRRHPEQSITPVSCLAHISRKFKEARHEHPRIGARILLLIGEIYRVEKRLDEQNAEPLDRQRARWLESRRPYDHLRKLARRLIHFRGITPGSGFYKALHYATGQLPHLEACFLDGRIRFDNNLTENAIRPTKLGHKNWMFIGGEHTGWRSAVIYTFVEQIRRHGADPFAYFEWVFEKLMHNPPEAQLVDLLPVNWLGSRPAAFRTIDCRIA